MQTRRTVLAGALALGACASPTEEAGPDDDARLAAIEATLGGGRLGVWAIDTGSGEAFGYRADARFAMCSTFKWLLAAAALDSAANGGPALGDPVLYREADLLGHAPATRARIQDRPKVVGDARLGEMTVEELCEAAVVVSDNTAANLLLELQMGPAGFTNFLRRTGDGVTRLDRNEPTLNENLPGDPRDTTSPRAMALSAARLLAGEGLAGPMRDRLIGWMAASATGLDRLRGGLPEGWRAGDKTGTGMNGAHNDVAIAWPPGRAPIVIASYITQGGADAATRAAAHAAVGALVARRWREG